MQSIWKTAEGKVKIPLFWHRAQSIPSLQYPKIIISRESEMFFLPLLLHQLDWTSVKIIEKFVSFDMGSVDSSSFN